MSLVSVARLGGVIYTIANLNADGWLFICGVRNELDLNLQAFFLARPIRS